MRSPKNKIAWERLFELLSKSRVSDFIDWERFREYVYEIKRREAMKELLEALSNPNFRWWEDNKDD